MTTSIRVGDVVNVLRAARLPKVEEVLGSGVVKAITPDGLYWITGFPCARTARELRVVVGRYPSFIATHADGHTTSYSMAYVERADNDTLVVYDAVRREPTGTILKYWLFCDIFNEAGTLVATLRNDGQPDEGRVE